jgi:PAP2 superfamily
MGLTGVVFVTSIGPPIKKELERNMTFMAKHLMSLMLLLCAIICAFGTTTYGASIDDEAQVSKDSAVNPVVTWNAALLVIVRTPGAQPKTVHPTRSFAIMHAAIYDAVNAIDKTHEPYLVRLRDVSRSASQDAAASAAAHEVLVALYPNFQATLDNQLKQSLALIPDGPDKTEGITIGKTVADQILAARSSDGSNAQLVPFVFGNAPGDFQSTPPNFPSPQFTNWSHVTPFALESASQFRLGPPPALTSDAYTDAFNEVKSLGIVNSITATADQMLTGHFWNGAIQNYWNEITQTATIGHNLNTARTARLFALLNLSFADGVIAFYDTKYTYNFWRPVTAIRAAASDGNPGTLADPNWLPEVTNTTPDPSYPGAHAVLSAAGASVLNSFFGKKDFDLIVTSEVLPGVTRSFTNFSAANKEATLSRIFAGVHFRTDLTSGNRMGSEVADFVVDNFMTPVHGRDDSEDNR